MNIEDVLRSHGIGVGGGSVIKSIQRGVTRDATLNEINNVTISSVDISKSIVIISTHSPATLAGVRGSSVRGSLTTSTNLQLVVGYINTNGYQPYVYWQVIEFETVKSIQRGAVAIDATPKTVTLNSIDVDKSILYFSTSLTTNEVYSAYVGGEIISATQLRFLNYNATSGATVQYYVVEFS